MKELNYSALFIPLFFLFVFLEDLLKVYTGNRVKLHFERSISNISIGVAERFIHLFTAIWFYDFFIWIYENYALYSIGSTPIHWIVLLLATDFVWYWYHRLGHEINFLWAAHIVHHQSEDFNLTAAVRITTLQAIVRYAFWGLLPLLGFHPNMVVSILLVHGIYSFFTHTEHFRRIPWMEHVFITPSLHGVHHASNEKYLDKNYGDVFVFWDKMFGTFQKEEEKPVYGLTHPLHSYSFLWQHFHYYLEILEAFRRASGYREKWNALFGSPAYMDQKIRPYLEQRFMQYRAHTKKELHTTFKRYILLQMAICVLVLTFATLLFDFLTDRDKIFLTVLTVLSLINCGALMEQRKWIFYLEVARLQLLFIYVSWHFDSYPLFILLFGISVLAQYLLGIRKRYDRYLLE